MSTDDQQRQESELEVLESIFNDERLFVRSKEGCGGQLSVTVNLPNDTKILYRSFDKTVEDDEKPEEADEREGFEVLMIQHLPPLNINFDLPPNYPSEAMPKYTLSCKWLTVHNLTKLCQKLDELWAEQQGCEILHVWYQVLTDETLSTLNTSSELCLEVNRNHDGRNSFGVDRRAVQDIASVQTLIVSLIEYNNLEEERILKSSYINCGVCFDEKLGSSCVRFPQCKHTYCSKCMKNYFTVQITDGAVKALTCPENKCDVQADPNMVKILVDDTVFEKYDKILLQRTLECMNDVVYCPRKTCQSPVLKEQDRDMGRCPACSFVFCVLCNTTYHGSAKCPMRSIEKRCGKQRIKNLIEEGYSEEWLENFTKNCPKCSASIQKLDGCNKMTCYSCRVNFCWICLSVLDRGDPYEHFNSVKSKCNNMMFEGMEVNFF